jgi:hypothetical protein
VQLLIISNCRPYPAARVQYFDEIYPDDLNAKEFGASPGEDMVYKTPRIKTKRNKYMIIL